MTGAWAEAAVGAVQGAGGCLTLDDLAQHRGEWVTPITGALTASVIASSTCSPSSRIWLAYVRLYLAAARASATTSAVLEYVPGM